MIINYYYRKNNIITDKLSKKLNLLDNNHKYINKNEFIITTNRWLIKNVTKYKFPVFKSVIIKKNKKNYYYRKTILFQQTIG